MEVDSSQFNFDTPNMALAPSTQQLPTPAAAAGAPVPNAAFGILVPGRPVRYDFSPVDSTGTKFALQLQCPGDLPQPLTLVHELVAFLGTPIAPDTGLLLYWQLSAGTDQSGFELLGCLTTEQPSQVFRTGWSEHDQFLALSPTQPATITIGLSLEPLEAVRNVASTVTGVSSKRPFVAQKIAQDLYNFMQSFDTSGAAVNGQMVVPSNIFERWWKRFETKSKRDPNFFLKTDS